MHQIPAYSHSYTGTSIEDGEDDNDGPHEQLLPTDQGGDYMRRVEGEHLDGIEEGQ